MSDWPTTPPPSDTLPDELERDYYDDLLGKGPGDPDMRDYGDNSPEDPEENWDEEND